MATKEYHKKEKSILFAVCIGVSISILVTLVGVFIMSLLISNETVSNDTIGYFVLIVTLISSMLGGVSAIAIAKRKFVIVCLSTLIAFALALISVTAMFYGGQYSGVPVTLLIIFCGGICSVMIASKMIGRQKIHRKKVKL